jgi:hypothetical protein
VYTLCAHTKCVEVDPSKQVPVTDADGAIMVAYCSIPYTGAHALSGLRQTLGKIHEKCLMIKFQLP